MVDQVVTLVAAGRRKDAVQALSGASVESDTLTTLLDDLIAVLSADAG
jgi:hypothetical protein